MNLDVLIVLSIFMAAPVLAWVVAHHASRRIDPKWDGRN